MYHQFPTYIHDKAMIHVLHEYDWMTFTNGTWTNCPYPIYKALYKAYTHNGNAQYFSELSGFANKRSTTSGTSTII